MDEETRKRRKKEEKKRKKREEKRRAAASSSSGKECFSFCLSLSFMISVSDSVFFTCKTSFLSCSKFDITWSIVPDVISATSLMSALI